MYSGKLYLQNVPDDYVLGGNIDKDLLNKAGRIMSLSYGTEFEVKGHSVKGTDGTIRFAPAEYRADYNPVWFAEAIETLIRFVEEEMPEAIVISWSVSSSKY